MLRSSVFFGLISSESLDKTGEETYSEGLRERRASSVLPMWRALDCQQKVIPKETRAVIQGCISSKANRSVHTELPNAASFALAELRRSQEAPRIR